MRILTLILAGGKGERLYPLTRDRAKPAVPFGGIYRIIDFTLSNCLHSGMKEILILTQYRSFSLEKHIQLGWNILCNKLGEFIHVVSAQQRIDEMWYQGTADAVYQNLYMLQQFRPDLTLVLSGDHLYRMDYRDLIQFHLGLDADLTVATVPQPREMSRHFGVMEVDSDQRVISFQEKPLEPRCLPSDPEKILASMGIYVFNTRKMVRCLVEDAKSHTQHDFGRNIIPRMVESKERVYAYIFWDPATKIPRYWRDVGTLDSYWEAHMDLLGERPVFDLGDPDWPILTHEPPAPPAKILGLRNGDGESNGVVHSMISNGCVLEARSLVKSVLSPNVRILKGAEVSESILLEGVTVCEGARLRRVIVDKRSIIPKGRAVGYDSVQDRKHFTVTDTGLVVIPTDSVLE
ncbi:MAG: glucose-1-phosphate adenylyltransferase [Thermodesulfobacteriota bacterium]